MRAIRRQLRAWQQDFMGFWGRFNTFYRTVFGIILAMVIVSKGRTYWIDPLNTKIAEAKEKLEKSKPEDPLPTIRADSEVNETLARIEDRRTVMQERKKEMEAIAASRPLITPSNKQSALSEFTLMFSRNNLMMLQGGPSIEAPPPPQAATKTRSTRTAKKTASNQPSALAAKEETSPLKTEKYEYRLEGRFDDIFAFLKDVSAYPYPARVSNIWLGIPEEQTTDATKSGAKPAPSQRKKGSPKLQLKFNLTFYLYE